MKNSFIGLTVPGWYTYLSSLTRVDEVNFWQPHGGMKLRALERGDLFFFKLRAPYRAIAGFGFFERYECMPAWLAWECFGQMNGAPDFETMIGQLLALRSESGPQYSSGEFEIGCIILSAPFFFKQDEWIAPPADWAKTGIQRGKTYNLEAGEGKRILQECLLRARQSGRHWNVIPAEAEAGEEARYGTPILVQPRLGQGGFSLAVRDAYQGTCAVTREHSLPVLEAAHIVPYAQGGEHRVDNGILLRRDLHRLFDHGYVTVTPDYEFRVGERLRAEFKNGRSYYSLDKTSIALPQKDVWKPSREFLEWHAEKIFKV